MFPGTSRRTRKCPNRGDENKVDRLRADISRAHSLQDKQVKSLVHRLTALIFGPDFGRIGYNVSGTLCESRLPPPFAWIAGSLPVVPLRIVKFFSGESHIVQRRCTSESTICSSSSAVLGQPRTYSSASTFPKAPHIGVSQTPYDYKLFYFSLRSAP